MPAAGPAHYWIAGRVVSAGDPAFPSRLLGAECCYTTARISAGRALHGSKHGERLAEDAVRLGLEPPPAPSVLEAFAALGRAEFGEGSGIVRLQAVRDESDRTVLIGIPRPLGEEPPAWSAIRASAMHMGPRRWGGAKTAPVDVYEVARREAACAGVDEALLFDAAGRLVEGARSNVLIVLGGDRVFAPPLALGGVAGLARRVLFARCPELREREVLHEDLAAARELIAINAVRGATAITRLDGAPIADGKPGKWAGALDALYRAGGQP